jgi:threonine dehydrogenase-like Zn-dependent dehydrogenase
MTILREMIWEPSGKTLQGGDNNSENHSHANPEPERRHEREAIVRPLAVAMCDLDLPMILGLTLFPLPIHLGHECVAEVVEGPGVCSR